MIKQTFITILCAVIMTAAFPAMPRAGDMRKINMEAEKKKNELLEKARLEEETAEKESQQIKLHIQTDKDAVLKAIRDLEIQNNHLEREKNVLEEELLKLKDKERQTIQTFRDVESLIHELVGVVRLNAKDLDLILNQSIRSAFKKDRGIHLHSLSESRTFPKMDDIRRMTILLFDEIRESGEVKVSKGLIVNRKGEEIEADILTLGNFTAAYQLPDETGFLIFSDKSRRFFALSKTPPFRIKNKIQKYMAGKSEVVPMDLSGGSALKQMVHQPTFFERIRKGGPIIWPILIILVLAFAIIVERLIHLSQKSMDSDDLIDQIKKLITKNEYHQCIDLCEKYKNKPISRVLMAGIHTRDIKQSNMENALQEAILREIPPLERFLSTLGMLAAIAPLLGLLGTVTGMINTFQAINHFGTGDPRMMSGGISEALVTTMLGLSVAIPIMLSHTLLSRWVERMIAQMEERAVTLINTISGLKT